MKIKKILIISLFLLILASVTIGASYAASSEKISAFSGKDIQTYDKNICSVDKIWTWDAKSNIKEHYKVNIKKANQNKYKIKSVKCKFRVYNSEATGEDIVYKTYDGKNKTSLVIKPSFKDFEIESITINYQTKEKIKSESTKFQQKTVKCVYYTEFIGKKAKINVTEKGYFSFIEKNDYSYSHKFNINTISQKDKIKTVKAIFYGPTGSIVKSSTFNGNGKTSLTKEIKGKFYDRTRIGQFQVSYS